MARVRLGRRSFLRLMAASGAGLALGGGIGTVAYPRESRDLRLKLGWLLRGMRLRLAGPVATVALAECPSYEGDVAACLRELWVQAKMPDIQGKRVLIKPNLIDVVEGSPATTNARLVGALLDVLAEMGPAELVVGDGPGFRREAGPVARACGLSEELERRRVPFVDLNYDEPAPLPAPAGWFGPTKELWLPRHVREADLIISVPKLKTHHWAMVSLSMKNLFGIFPGARYGWPKNLLHVNGIDPSILGLYEAARGLAPVVSVIDGIEGMEGDGPIFGQGLAHGLLAMGADPLAVDMTCAGLMGFTLGQVKHLELAASAGLGQVARLQLAGAPPERLQRTYRIPPRGDEA